MQREEWPRQLEAYRKSDLQQLEEQERKRRARQALEERRRHEQVQQDHLAALQRRMDNLQRSMLRDQVTLSGDTAGAQAERVRQHLAAHTVSAQVAADAAAVAPAPAPAPASASPAAAVAQPAASADTECVDLASSSEDNPPGSERSGDAGAVAYQEDGDGAILLSSDEDAAPAADAAGEGAASEASAESDESLDLDTDGLCDPDSCGCAMFVQWACFMRRNLIWLCT